MSYTYVTSTEEPMGPHANHNWESWHAYVNDLSDAPMWVLGSDAGLCCHDCRLIIVDPSSHVTGV